MKKLAGISLLLLIFPLVSFAQGSRYEFGTTIQINRSDSIETNLISAGQFINIMGRLNDDLFSAAQNIRISGSIADDALLAGREVEISGSVGDMLLAVGETIIIDGEVEGDLLVAGNEIMITPNARIHGNLAMAGNELNFDGAKVDGWLRASGEKMKLNGSVGSYAELYGENFNFGSEYSARTGTNITTSHELDRSEMGSPPDNLKININDGEEWIYEFFVSIWFYVSLLITGIILMAIFRQTTGDLYLFARERYGRNTGYGALLFFGIPIASVILMVLILTIPLSFIVFMLYGFALLLGYLLASISIGTAPIRYFKEEKSFSDYYWGLLLGMIIISLLSMIPIVGWAIGLILIFFGLGSLITYIWELRKSE